MLVFLVASRGQPRMNVEGSFMRRLLFLIALLALVLGGPVSVAATIPPAMAQECLHQCEVPDWERATLPPCCAVAQECRVNPSDSGPYVGASRWAQAATKPPMPAKEPNPCPPILVELTHQLPPVPVRAAIQSNPNGFIEAMAKPLYRACVLRINNRVEPQGPARGSTQG